MFKKKLPWFPVRSLQEAVTTLGNFAGTCLPTAVGHRDTEEWLSVSEALAYRLILHWILYCSRIPAVSGHP